ncbi:MAG: glycosyltransferase family 4 protein [bacterium]|nr:glycosyltransferase family 4 protein [bacterium]
MKSLLLITDIFPPEIGGPASFMVRLAATLAARGSKVTVVCATPAEGHDDRQFPFRVYRHSRRQFGFRTRTALRIARELLAHDACLVNGLEYLTAIAARIVRRPYTIKIVGDIVWEMARHYALTASDIDAFQSLLPPSEKLRTLARRRRWYLNGAATVIVPSNYLRGLVRGWGIPAEKIRVIQNGIPTEDYRQWQPQRRGASTPLRVAFCGRLTNWKGVDTLLEAAAAIKNINIDIIGDGPERAALEKIVTARGVNERVTFTGRLDEKAARDRLAKSHVLVLDSAYEGHSHVLLEAGALGLAPIASRCGGNPEIVRDGENGILVAPHDVPALRDALERLEEDEPLRFRLASAAKNGSQRYSFSNTMTAILDLISG